MAVLIVLLILMDVHHKSNERKTVRDGAAGSSTPKLLGLGVTSPIWSSVEGLEETSLKGTWDFDHGREPVHQVELLKRDCSVEAIVLGAASGLFLVGSDNRLQLERQVHHIFLSSSDLTFENRCLLTSLPNLRTSAVAVDIQRCCRCPSPAASSDPAVPCRRRTAISHGME